MFKNCICYYLKELKLNFALKKILKNCFSNNIINLIESDYIEFKKAGINRRNITFINKNKENILKTIKNNKKYKIIELKKENIENEINMVLNNFIENYKEIKKVVIIEQETYEELKNYKKKFLELLYTAQKQSTKIILFINEKDEFYKKEIQVLNIISYES